jgi:hypothetical protein
MSLSATTSDSKLKVVEEATHIFDRQFPANEFKVNACHFDGNWPNSESNPDLCIMGSPHITLNHPMIDFDVTQACDVIYSAARMDLDDRLKPLCAVVRGQGGGKTRQIVEINKYFKSNYTNVFALAITFNSKWDTKQSVLDTCADYQMSVIFETISRMTSILYGIDFFKACTIFNSIELRNSIRGYDAITVLQGFVDHVMASVRSRNSGIDTFILMVDESRKLRDKIARSAEDDPLRVLREGLLDGKFNNVGHVGVLMSALDITPLGETSTSRPIVSFPEKERLTPSIVAQKWLKVSPNNLANLALIAVFSGLPRGLQFLSYFFNGSSGNVTKANSKEIIQGTIQQYVRQYNCELPAMKYVFPLVFGMETLIDTSVMSCIEDSFYTNYIRIIKSRGASITPITSLCAFYSAASRSAVSKSTEKSRAYATYILQRFDNIINSIETLLEPQQSGALLEICFRETILLRLRTALAAKTRVTLEQLLSLSMENFVDYPAFQEIMERKLEYVDMNQQGLGDNQGLPSLRKKSSAFFSYLEKASKKPCFWAAAEGDCFDYLLMVRLVGRDQPIFIFFDLKSPINSSDPKESLLKKFSQAKDLESLLESSPEGSIARGLLNLNNVLYVYATGYDGSSTLEDLNKVEDKRKSSGEPYKMTTLVMRNNEMMDLMRLIWDLYICGRNALNDEPGET